VASTVTKTKSPKIGFVLSTTQEERYQKDRKVFEETVTSLGGSVLFVTCENNEQLQLSEVEALISQGIKVLVLQPVNGETASVLVKLAKKRGIAVVNYDRLIKKAPLDAYITEDSEKVGELQAEAAVRFTNYKGNYVILMGQAEHSVTEARTAGVLKVLSKYPEIKIVVKEYHNAWSPSLAKQTSLKALSKFDNQIDAIIANNSGMAHGAVQAVEERKLLGKVFIAGADGDLGAIRDMLSGKQAFDVFVSITDMARRAAEIAMNLTNKSAFKYDSLTDNELMKVKTINTPVYPISKNDIEERILKTGFHSREAVYGKPVPAE